ncbi:hypothetical protein ALP82_200288 [Pseudomonas savastanoi pv. fraxini]|nr:hypothetical protein ALP82_200288 [Pseudomonas savastanoi pv. fraxini]
MYWRVVIWDHCKKLSSCSGYFYLSPTISINISLIAFSSRSATLADWKGVLQECVIG